MNRLYENILDQVQGVLSGAIQTRKDTLKALYTSCARLYLIDRFFWASMFADPSDIFFSSTEEDPRWAEIMKRRSEVVLNEDLKLMASARKFNDTVKVGLAGMSKGSTYKKGVKQKVMTAAYFSLYFFASRKRDSQSEFFAANPDVQTSASLWNMLDDFFIKSVNGLFLRKLETVQVIRVPKLDIRITLENIDNLPKFN